MELPESNTEKMYNFFDKVWEEHLPNYVIGYPEVRTCTNHRMEILAENYDFVACKLPESINISSLTHNLPLEEDLQKFFKALILFQRTMGSNSLGIFDFYLENKIIRLSRRYVASIEEYKYYWDKNGELNYKISENRKKHYKCFWCYQTFIGLGAQGLSKGILYDRPDYIPKAMQDLIFTLPMINIPLYYISKTVCEYLGNPSSNNALIAYNNLINSMISNLEKDDPNFISKFETLLYQKNFELLDIALKEFQKNLIVLNASRQEALDNVQVLLGADRKIIRKIDSESHKAISVTLEDFLPKKHQKKYYQRKKQ